MAYSGKYLNIEVIPVTAYQQNCSVIQCKETKDCVVVDPGGEIEKILSVIKSMSGVLKAIWVTHAHIDHAGGVQVLHEKTGVPILGPHQEDDFWIDNMPQQSVMLGFKDVKTFVPSKWLQQGDVVQVGNQEFFVIHVPGHTPGHVVFYHQGEQIAFVGDVIFQGSIGRTDFPKGNHEQLITGIKTKLFTLDDEVSFVPGHGPNSTFGYEKLHNPFLI